MHAGFRAALPLLPSLKLTPSLPIQELTRPRTPLSAAAVDACAHNAVDESAGIVPEEDIASSDRRDEAAKSSEPRAHTCSLLILPFVEDANSTGERQTSSLPGPLQPSKSTRIQVAFNWPYTSYSACRGSEATARQVCHMQEEEGEWNS